jgi:glycosyltransferase involved in cell wall biosynthesis
MVSEGQNSQKVAYLLKRFPRLSETFILHEVLELERQGLALQIYSLLTPENQMVPAAQAVRSPITYLPQKNFPGLVRLLAAAARRFFKNPWKFAAVSAAALIRFRRQSKAMDILYASYLSGQLEQAGVTHLHAHYANTPSTVALLVHQFTGIPFSFTAHAKDIYLSSKQELAYKMRRARMVVTCTGYNQQYLARLLDPQDRVTIHRIYHGLDLSIFPADAVAFPDAAASEDAADSPVPRPLILSVARLVEKKGLAYLLQACRQLKDQGIDFDCRIIGEGPLRPQLEQQIRELNIADRVELCGAETHERVIDLYRQASVMVLPAVVAENGDRDGIPNVLVEAMMMGAPVISTPVSGIPELLTTESNGLLVAERDSAALAEAIARLLGDSDLRARLTAAARRTVLERFDMATNARHLTNLLRNHPVDAGLEVRSVEPGGGPHSPMAENFFPTGNDN